MIAKRLLVGLVALGVGMFVVVAGDGFQQVRAQQQPPFTVPHGGYGQGTELCAICHDWHPTPNPDLLGENEVLSPDTPVTFPWEGLLVREHERDVCYMCHDGSASATNIESDFGADTRVSAHPVLERRDDVLLTCSDCHAEHQDPTEDTMLLYRETTPGTYVFSPPSNPLGDTFCYGCHGSASALPAPFGDHALFETSIHATDGRVDPSTPETDLKCSACHEPHASDYPYLTRANEEDLCFTCHTAANPTTANGSNPEVVFGAVANDYTPGAVRIYHHPVAESEQAGGTRVVECASCHNSHLVNRTETASDPARARAMDSGWRFEWDTGSGLYNRSPNATAYCGTCHVGPTVTAPLTPGVDVPYDVRLADDGAHDRFAVGTYLSSAHGDPSYVSGSYDACPPGEPCNLACTACHDFHGSTNAFMLRERITSPDYGPVDVLVAEWLAETVTEPAMATLTLANMGGIQTGFYVDISGVSQDEYNGTFEVIDTTASTITYELPLTVDPGPGVGGRADPRGVGDARPSSATVSGFGATNAPADIARLQTFCLTCHLEQSPSHFADQLCTLCHDHSASSPF